MKILQHDLRQIKYKILQLYYKENVFLFSWMNVAETAILSGFIRKMALVF